MRVIPPAATRLCCLICRWQRGMARASRQGPTSGNSWRAACTRTRSSALLKSSARRPARFRPLSHRVHALGDGAPVLGRFPFPQRYPHQRHRSLHERSPGRMSELRYGAGAGANRGERNISADAKYPAASVTCPGRSKRRSHPPPAAATAQATGHDPRGTDTPPAGFLAAPPVGRSGIRPTTAAWASLAARERAVNTPLHMTEQCA